MHAAIDANGDPAGEVIAELVHEIRSPLDIRSAHVPADVKADVADERIAVAPIGAAKCMHQIIQYHQILPDGHVNVPDEGGS